MDNQDLKLQRDKVPVELYEQWLNHPITILFKRNLFLHKEKALRFIFDKSSDPKVSDSEIRQQVHIAKTTDVIMNLFQYEIFVRNLETKQSNE